VADQVANLVGNLVGNPLANMAANPVVMSVVMPAAPPASVGPVMAVQVGRTIRGVKAQAMVVQVVQVVQVDRICKVGRAALPVNMAGIPSGKWSVLNPFRGKRAAARIRTAVVVPVVVDAIVDAVQTLVEGLAVRAIGNVSRVNFRGKRPRVDHRSNIGPRVNRARKVFPVRQVFLGPLGEPAHRGHRASQAPRVIRTLRVLPIRRTPPVHPAHPVRRDPLGLPVLHGSRDFRVTMAQ
jgi:hypothetical protein